MVNNVKRWVGWGKGTRGPYSLGSGLSLAYKPISKLLLLLLPLNGLMRSVIVGCLRVSLWGWDSSVCWLPGLRIWLMVGDLPADEA